jgi:hypothetical protein
MKIDLDVNLREQDNMTVVSFVAGVDILGKLAALGHGIIKRKADQVLDEFAQAVKNDLRGRQVRCSKGFDWKNQKASQTSPNYWADLAIARRSTPVAPSFCWR